MYRKRTSSLKKKTNIKLKKQELFLLSSLCNIKHIFCNAHFWGFFFGFLLCTQPRTLYIRLHNAACIAYTCSQYDNTKLYMRLTPAAYRALSRGPGRNRPSLVMDFTRRTSLACQGLQSIGVQDCLAVIARFVINATKS